MSDSHDVEVPLVSYLIHRAKQPPVRIKIPKTWKITFGPVTPSKGGYGSDDHCLRIYETKDQQRALFEGVTSFMDESIPFTVLQGDPNGNKSAF